MRQNLKNTLEKIKSYFSDKQNRNKCLKILLQILALLLAIYCIIKVFLRLTAIVTANLETIETVIGITFFITILVLGFSSKRKPRPKPEPQTVPNNYLQYDPIALESTYRLIRSGVCLVIGEVCDIIKVRKPMSHSQMDAPTHYDIVANVPIYHYLVPKQDGEVDTYAAMGILQDTLTRKLQNNELPGITQSAFMSNGRTYPFLMIDNIHDNGIYLQIDIAMASENYCRYREQRLYQSMNQSGVITPMDRDF